VKEIFTLLLIGVLIASVISFLVMGLRQMSRTSFLARKAHEMELHFAPGDPFDVPRRYGGFSLISNGHGPRAFNVTHGRISSAPIRAFDFRYEIGHATRRSTRHYAVVMVHLHRPLGDLLMWHVDDSLATPLSPSRNAVRIGAWICRGDIELAGLLSEACGPLEDRIVSLEVRKDTVMLCVPIVKRKQDYTASIRCVDRVLAGINEYCA